MGDLYRDSFSRNIGFITEAEQAILRRSTVAIAGMGGVGGLLAERLVRLGLGRLKIADPESFEVSNLNRQYACSTTNLGLSKAAVLRESLSGISPGAVIEHSESGIECQKDADSFVADSDLVVDEMDFGLFRESVFLQRAARRSGVYYMFASAVGFGALLVLFDPKGLTLEEYNGFAPDVDPQDIEGTLVPQQSICPVVPTYAQSMAPEMIREIMLEGRPAPTNSIGTGLAAMLAANETMNVLLRKRDIAAAPRYTFVDLLDREMLVGTLDAEAA